MGLEVVPSVRGFVTSGVVAGTQKVVDQQGTATGGQSVGTPQSVNSAPVDSFGTPAPSLEEVRTGGKRLTLGMQGESVKKLKDMLVETGLLKKADAGASPDVFDKATEDAVKSLQQKLNLNPGAAAGQVGGTTLRRLEGVTGPLPKTGDPFLDKVAQFAINSQRETGVPASVTLAQAALESGWGESDLAKKANNFFGIKGKGPSGESVVMPTQENYNGRWVTENARFAKFSSPEEAFNEHGRFLQRPHYAEAFKAKDAAGFARAIHKAGYATDPNYSDKLIKLMNQFDLTRFDDRGRLPGAQQ